MSPSPAWPTDEPVAAHDQLADREPITYMRQLDGLRAVAVMLVFVQHWVPRRIAFQVIPWGGLGVHQFFVLSGFLITSILLRCRAAQPGPPRRRAILVFYARRSLRIFPVYYALLLLVCLLDVEAARQTIWWHVTYLSNFYFAKRGAWQGHLSHFWSLAAEEQFYLCLPWLVVFCRARFLPIAVSLLPVFGFTARLCLIVLNAKTMNLLPLTSLDSLGFGGILAWLEWGNRGMSRGWHGVLLHVLGIIGRVAFLLLQMAARTGWVGPQALVGPTSLALMCGWVLWRAAHGFGGVTGWLLESAPMTYLGRISYGLYLFHKFAPLIWWWMLRSLDLPMAFQLWWVRLPAFFAITLAMASVSWLCFEKPLLDLKRFVTYAQK